MSHFAVSSTIETALSRRVVARLIFEGCELLIGSEYGAVLLPLQVETRSFEPILPPSLPVADLTGCSETIKEVLAALRTKRTVEISGTGKTGLLRALTQQSNLYPHGTLYLNQTETIEDLLQTIFERLYWVAADVQPSRAEIRSGLCDRQALILLDQPKLTESDLIQMQQALPESCFVIASIERRFSQIESAIELPDLRSEINLRLTDSETAILELLATVEISLSTEQIGAIANASEFQRLIDFNLISVEQKRYGLQQNYPICDRWMEKVLAYVLKWVQSQPEEILKERELLMVTLQWSVEQKRWLEAAAIARSIETEFAIAKLWGSWSKILRWSLAAAWGSEDEALEAWALHQLGTLAFCQEEVTAGYDRLREALAVRSELGEQTAIAFSQHNLAQIKALIVPVQSEDRPYQRHFYWMVGIAFAITAGVSIAAVRSIAQPQVPIYLGFYRTAINRLFTRFS